MLANIHVKNMALIKEADISLGKGLNILSGETGAGKSILLGSIAVALGLQNFKGFAREDADYALSELVFVIENEEQRQALLELEIPVEDGEVIISRRLSKGRTTSKINGETVPVSMVRKAGTLLIDIHGQHENQSLLHIRKHLELLDDFAGEKLALAKEKYKARYQEYGELKKELDQAQLDNATRAKEMDFLSFEIGEIEEAALQKGEDEALEDDYKRLANGKEILESVLEAHQLCASDGASEAIGRALRSLASVSEYDSDLKALYNQLMDVDSLLNDFNREISGYADELDVDEETLKKTFAKIDEYRTQNLDISSFFAFKNLVAGLSNNENDYKLFYHNTKQGRMRHDKVHNIFGYNMTRAAGEAFEQLEPDKRILMYSRSACIGMHRYGGIWTGDNQSWWSHILLSLHMMPSLNMCGFLYEGPDIGGFGSNTTEDLVLRWYGVGIFSPLLRNHSAAGTRKQEPYRFKNKAAFAGILQLRYLLLPYIYSEYMKAALRDGMYCMPLAFAFPNDAFARQVEDEVMLGDRLMIAPVYEQNARGRYVYLPEEMLQVRVKCSENDRMETTVLPAGHHYIPVELDEVVFFVRKGHILPIAKGGDSIQNVASVIFADLCLFAHAPDGAAYEYYTDDGETKDYDKPEHFVHITLDADGNAESDCADVKVEKA